jgi:3-oxoacyl-[acyl-carrier protein] reductase
MPHDARRGLEQMRVLVGIAYDTRDRDLVAADLAGDVAVEILRRNYSDLAIGGANRPSAPSRRPAAVAQSSASAFLHRTIALSVALSSWRRGGERRNDLEFIRKAIRATRFPNMPTLLLSRPLGAIDSVRLNAGNQLSVRSRNGRASNKEGEVMDLGIKGRSAIVTGGSRGIGKESARQFLREGVKVAISAREGKGIEEARAELEKESGGTVVAIQADMTKLEDIERLVATAKQKLGGIDILVNNAGTMYSGRFAALTEEGLRLQLETKLFGFMRMIRLVYPVMKAGHWGRIVNLIGGAGKEPDPYMFGSGMTNSALLNLTKSLSTEFGEDNVLVNAVCPGWVDTALWRRNAQGLAAEVGAKSEEEARRAAARRNSLNRFGKPEELASAIVFLCSERASYITGVSLNVDGGRLKGLW